MNLVKNLDIDECATTCYWPYCICNNSIGSFSCSCEVGLKLNETSCVGKFCNKISASVLKDLFCFCGSYLELVFLFLINFFSHWFKKCFMYKTFIHAHKIIKAYKITLAHKILCTCLFV